MVPTFKKIILILEFMNDLLKYRGGVKTCISVKIISNLHYK